MDLSYEESIRRVLASEGGYVNHPADPGGPTNFGITLADYRRYVKPSASADDVRKMNVVEARGIYRTKYWLAMGCEALPFGLDYCTFDYGVNSGIGRGGKVLRRLCGLPDNADESAVLKALDKRDPKAVISAMMDERLRFLKGLKTWSVFGPGWTHRCNDVRAAALQMADRSTLMATKNTVPESPQGKGVVAKPVPTALAPVGGAAGLTGAIAWAGQNPLKVTLALVVLAAAIGGLIWLSARWHQTRQEAPTPNLIPVPEKS